MYLQIPSCWENTKGLRDTEIEEEIVAVEEHMAIEKRSKRQRH